MQSSSAAAGMRAFVRRGVVHMLALLPALAVAPAAQAQCDTQAQCCVTPQPGGNPECGDGPADLPRSAPAVNAGNPLDIISGNKYQKEVDLPALPGVLGLEGVRHYNSARSHQAGTVGRGWRLSYEATLSESANALTIVQPDGTSFPFVRGIVEPDVYRGSHPQHGTVRREPLRLGDARHIWTWPDGRRLHFDGKKLAKIVVPTGESVTILYAPNGQLLWVSDPQGRRLYVKHHPSAVRARGVRPSSIRRIETPAASFDYAYEAGSGNLRKVARSDRTARLYHYEDPRHPHKLTGISVDGTGSDGRALQQRLAAWGYDEQGRAVSSVKGDGTEGVERVHVEREFQSSGGRATLTNSLGQRTEYRWRVVARQHRLIEVRGPGCSTCGDTNVRYAYDGNGVLTETTRLDARGMPVVTTRLTHDPLGRVVRISQVGYRHGRAQPEQWVVRQGYADATSSQPSLIARPSVLAGREHTLQFEFNANGQPTRVVESGHSPLGEDGRLSASGTAITRTTSYTYTGIGGRSVLTQIDGPLPNGPKGTPEDSDIVQVRYDANGDHVVALVEPGGFQSKVAHDSGTGRLVRVEDDEGRATEFAYDARGQFTRIRSIGGPDAAPRDRSFKYDAIGQLIETGAGSVEDQSYRPLQRHGIDAYGRRQWTADALGVLAQFGHDTEGRVTQIGRHSNAVGQVQRYGYDANGRLAQLVAHTGGEVTIERDAHGRVRAVNDALGRRHEPGKDEGDRPSTSRELLDDRGRVVATQSPDAGATERRYDAADRLVAATDAAGNGAVYDYDAAGRITRQRLSEQRTGQVTETRWRYAGRRLQALEHPTQSERYEYDSGWMAAKIVTQRHDDGAERTSVTRYAYDDGGSLESISLPDGSRVRYRRNGQGQVVALERSRVQSAWLEWLLPAQTVVKDIERDLVGPSRQVAGNGIESRAQRSAQGALARVVHRHPGSAMASAPFLPGVAFAHAAPAASAAASAAHGAADAKQLPGALGVPTDPQALISREGCPDRVRVIWRETDIASSSKCGGISYEGPLIGDHIVPTGERIPQEVIDSIRQDGGQLRVKFRLSHAGVYLGWDIERFPGYDPNKRDARGNVINVEPVYSMVGGDFREADIFNGKAVRKGWYIDKKTGRKIETDF